ncbi:hypothetical protein IFM89_006700 [Coptis chinensis]|uniref:Uncharacterized protein n=1 Tax=Coptis chinensis TaxID=261450 RepID=A0A835HCI6_9MAGN|nr:hypothetical protein IFM89_006700 [Coptis chinensis]
MLPKCQWVIGNGQKVDTWRDGWINSVSLKQALNISTMELRGCRAKVEDLIVNGNRVIPDIIQEVIELAGFNVASLAEHDNGRSKDHDLMESLGTPTKSPLVLGNVGGLHLQKTQLRLLVMDQQSEIMVRLGLVLLSGMLREIF